MSGDAELTRTVKQLAREAGFARVGVASVGRVPSAEAYRNWIAAGYHAEQGYLAENVPMRLDPSRLVEGARSVICLAVSYHPGESGEPGGAFIARYARGRDYHRVLKQRAHALCDRLAELRGEFSGRAFVDTAPLAERSLAAMAGLGWIGRHGNLIVPGLGSYVFLAEVVCNLPLQPDRPRESGCGDCSRCVSACPTEALLGGGVLDCSRCLSYLTIEHRGRIDRALWGSVGSRVFGCDTCQSVCPHNRNRPSGEAELLGQPAPARAELGEILRWTEADWDALTRGSARRRAGFGQWLRNAVLAAGCSGEAGLIEPLETLRGLREELCEEIDWAVGCLRGGQDV